MANTGSKIYRTLRLFINGVRSEHVKPNYATDPNYIPPFTDLNSCYTNAPTPVPVPIPTPSPVPVPVPAPTVAPVPVPSPTPSPVPAPGVIPVAPVPTSKPPVVPTPVGGGITAYLSGPKLHAFDLCASNYAMTTRVQMGAVSISESLNKVVSRGGIAFGGNDRWYAAAVAKDLTTESSFLWYAIFIDAKGIVREIVDSKILCRVQGRETDYSGDDDPGTERTRQDGVLNDVRGKGQL
jgi:hypothetical protein